MKDSFLMYLSFEELLMRLTPDELRSMVLAIFQYHRFNTEPDFAGNRVLEMCWQPLRAQFERDRIKYQTICDRNRKNGVNGGRPAAENPDKPKKPSGFSGNPDKPKKPDTDTDTDTGTGTGIIYLPPIVPPLKRGGDGGEELPFDMETTQETTQDATQETTPDTVQDQLKARINALFKRRNTTVWSDKERKALRDVSKREGVLDEMTAIETLYNGGYPYRRRDVYTFLNNFATEFDRAQNRQQTSGFNREGSEGSYGRYTPRNG